MRKNIGHTVMNAAKATLKNLKAKFSLPFSEILPDEWIHEVSKEVKYRNRFFTPSVTVHTFLAQVTSDDQSCQKAVAKVLAHLEQTESEQLISANTSAYCQARNRLPESMLPTLAKKAGKEVHERVPDEFKWRGRSVKLTDGTNASMPDTAANQAAYPQSVTQKKMWDFQLSEWSVSFLWKQAHC